MKSSLWLSAGVVLGAMLTALGALVPSGVSLSEGVIARVNGKAITDRDLTFALERLDKNEPSSSQRRLEILNHLINQELLVQRGVHIGLLESDHTVRKTIAMTMVDAIVAQVLAKEPTEEELRAFYQSHLAVFTSPVLMHVQQIFCAGEKDRAEAYTRAEQARTALMGGMSFQEVRERYGDTADSPIPDALAPLSVLQRLLGPTLSDVLQTLEVGDVSAVTPSSAGYHLLRLVERQAEQQRPYETVKEEVRAEYLHRKRDEALQQYLDRLRQEATIVLSPKAPRPDMIAKTE